MLLIFGREVDGLDRFERMTTLLRQGRTEQARRLHAEDPAAWLPRWTAGDPLSPAWRRTHRLGNLITAVDLDETSAWALAGATVHRISRADGSAARLRLDGTNEYFPRAVFAGDTVVAIDEDGQVLQWNRATGELLLASDPDDVPRRAGDLCSLAVGAGVAVTGTEAGYLLCWDLTDGRLLARAAAHDGAVWCVAISADGGMLLSVGGGDSVRLRFSRLDGLRPVVETDFVDASAAGWTVLDGQRRAVIVAGGRLTVWDGESATPVSEFPTTASSLSTLAFTAGGARAVLADDVALRIVDLRDGMVRGTVRTDFAHHVGRVAADDRCVFVAQSGSTEGRTNLLELVDPLPQDPTVRQRVQGATSATVGGREVVVAVDQDGRHHVCEPADGRSVGEPGEPTRQWHRIPLRTATVAGEDQVLSMWRRFPTAFVPATGEVRTPQRQDDASAILAAAATRAGLLALLDTGGVLDVWDVATLTRHASTRIADPGMTYVVALGELRGRTVVLVGTADGGFRWFDAVDLSELPPPGRFAGHVHDPDRVTVPTRWPGPDAVRALEVAGDTVVFAIGGTVRSAGIATGEPVGPALVHPANVCAVAPAVLDGVPVVATSCEDRVVRIWEIASGRERLAVALPRVIGRIVSVGAEQVVVLDDECLVAFGPAR